MHKDRSNLLANLPPQSPLLFIAHTARASLPENSAYHREGFRTNCIRVLEGQRSLAAWKYVVTALRLQGEEFSDCAISGTHDLPSFALVP